MKQKILDVTAFILIAGSWLWVYIVIGGLEQDVLTVGQALARSAAGFAVMFIGAALTRIERSDAK